MHPWSSCPDLIRASIILQKRWIAGSRPGNDELGTVTAFCSSSTRPKEILMTITVAHVTPLVALIAGILILIVPRLLNYVVAVYLIIVGLVGLNGIYHFIR
jgi:hypothetical protein